MPQWFPSQVDYEQRVGAPMTFTGDPDAEDAAGAVLVWDPPHRFAFTWGDDEVHLTVEPFEGGTRLTLLNLLHQRGTAAMNAGGWHQCLDEARPARGRRAAGRAEAPRRHPWRPLYRSYVDAGLPADVPPPPGD
nr:SRPBCC domain-containing protein [Angustibacter aerolatus]